MKHNHSGPRQRRQPYAWLGAGAVTLGIGAALASGSAVAYADTGAGSGAGKASTDSSSASSNSGSTTAKKATAHSARNSAATSSGGSLSSRKASSAAASSAPAAAAVVDTDATETATSSTTSTAAIPSATGHAGRVRATAAVVFSSAAASTPVDYSWLPSTPPVVASVAVNLAQQQIALAQAELTQQTWGSGNIAAGLLAIAPQVLLAQAGLALNTWENSISPAQLLYARTSGVPIVHELAGVGLIGALLLPTMATTALNSTGLLLPLVGAFEGGAGITPVQNAVSTAALNSRVYALVPVTMRATTEPIVYVTINGGPSTPVLVDTGSSGLVITMASVGDANPLGACTGDDDCKGSSGYSGGLTYNYTTYTTTVNFGNGIVSEPTNVNIVDTDDAASALAFFHQLGGASGVLGIGANAAGPGPSIPTTALPGDLSQGVYLYQSLFLGIAGVMVLGPNPLPTRTSVSGAPDAYLNVKINNGSPTAVGAIIDSGGVYGTILQSMVGSSTVPVGTRISVYTPEGVLLYAYTVTSQNRPTVITSGLINTGYVPYQHGPVYLDYTTPDGQGATHFDYA